jgi:hypothetical protein
MMLSTEEAEWTRISFARGIYSYSMSVLTLGAGVAFIWAGFRSRLIDPVPILGGACLIFGSFAFLIGTVQARRPPHEQT